MLLSGMRFGEAAGLRWDEVDLVGQRINLPAARVKTGHARTVTLTETPAMLDLLRALSLRREAETVFAGMTRDRAEKARRRLATTYGAPSFQWHGLRRTCGTILTNSPAIYGAASAFLSAKRLGHGVVVAERSYTGALPGLPADARTLEAAAGIEDLAARIVRSVGGLVSTEADRTAVG